MPRRTREVEAIIQGKFHFVPMERGRSDDHRYYELNVPGVETIITKFSHSNQEISDDLQGKIAGQLLVRNRFFAGMLDCTNSREAYIEQIQTNPFRRVPYRQ
jgi:hypothetical protein